MSEPVSLMMSSSLPIRSNAPGMPSERIPPPGYTNDPRPNTHRHLGVFEALQGLIRLTDAGLSPRIQARVERLATQDSSIG